MFSRIIRSLFVVACTITGGMWASYLFDEYTERALIHRAQENAPSASDTSQGGTGLKLPKATPAEQPQDGAAGGPQTAPGDIDSVVPDELEIARTPFNTLKYVEESVVFRRFIPFIIALGGLCGLLVAFFITFALRFVTQEAFERFFPALVSVLLAMAVGLFLAWYIVHFLGVKDQTLQIYIQATLVIVFFFIGVNLGLTRTSSWENLVRAVSRKTYEGRNPKIMDTSVIIDGRIADICKAGFIDGTIIVPRFVLQELQSIADSSDSLRRARGRRGLDILKQLQAVDSGVSVEIVEDDPQHVHTVDAKLVALAKDIAARVITNDQNLLKVAQIEGVSVMNIHDLANALKTIVIADEQMQVRVVREGKEPQQGVGYLDDGTMVVVDGGRDHVGRNVVATVTSVLQTSNGRMIFTKLHSAESQARPENFRSSA